MSKNGTEFLLKEGMMAGGGPPTNTLPTRYPQATATLPTGWQGQSVYKLDKLRRGRSSVVAAPDYPRHQPVRRRSAPEPLTGPDYGYLAGGIGGRLQGCETRISGIGTKAAAAGGHDLAAQKGEGRRRQCDDSEFRNRPLRRPQPAPPAPLWMEGKKCRLAARKRPSRC